MGAKQVQDDEESLMDPMRLAEQIAKKEDFRGMRYVLKEKELATLENKGYNVKEVLDYGSYSMVYRVQYIKGQGDQNLQFPRDVPVNLVGKVIEIYRAPKELIDKFLLREIAILTQISHPHIIHVHSILHLNTKMIIFTRFAEDGNLCDYIITYGPLPEKKARVWFRQIAVALQYLHTINIVHRSVKCENILITCNSNMKLCDFGFARHCVDSNGEKIKKFTYCSSLGYAAPELIKGIPHDPKLSEVWSLGVVLYIMLNGVMPFRTNQNLTLWSRQIKSKFRFLRNIVHKVSPQSIEVVQEMLNPIWYRRISLNDVLASEWIGMVPKLLTLSPMEASAQEKAEEIKGTVRPKTPIKLVIKAESLLTVQSNEQLEEELDDEVTEDSSEFQGA